MSTQGVVSVTKDGKVVAKCVVGCNGYNAPDLAERLRRLGRITQEGMYRAAAETDFGCDDCRVVVTEEGILSRSVEDVGPLYLSTFQQPEFNPRWECGAVGHLEIVDREATWGGKV